MIEDLIRVENCRFKDEVADWKDAIHTALVPLLEGGWCTSDYEQAVLDNTKKYGAYYVLTPDLALIHAEPEKGVNDTQMAVTVLKEPVKFTEDGHAVRVLTALSAKDRYGHMEGIQAVSNIFMDPEKVNQVLEATTSSELWNLFVENAAPQS